MESIVLRRIRTHLGIGIGPDDLHLLSNGIIAVDCGITFFFFNCDGECVPGYLAHDEWVAEALELRKG